MHVLPIQVYVCSFHIRSLPQPDLAVEHVKALSVELFGGCDIAVDSRRGQSIGITWSFAGSQAGHQYGCVILSTPDVNPLNRNFLVGTYSDRI